MVLPDVDARSIASILSVCSAGIAVTAPHDDLEVIIDGLSTLLTRGVDAEVTDTTAGKRAFYDWATGSLSSPELTE
jgi:hypothetical protein